MDNRKLRYAKRKAKEKILSQRDRAYYRNLNFRENQNEQAEESPEHYAAQNASLYGRKYALPLFSRKSKGTGAAGVKTAKRLPRSTKKVISFIVTGGSAMLLLLAVIIPLCAAAAVFGSDDDGEITSDDVLVAIAQSQLGNEGGEIYWRWYGFDSHVDWCAIFVSWCADQAGMLETDSLPKYAGCDEGIRWFIKKGKWYNRKIEPKPGMIIFFDWDDDGASEHTGIVEKYEDGLIYTIEGNSHDVCRRKWYAAGDKCIMGYGGAIKTKPNDL